MSVRRFLSFDDVPRGGAVRGLAAVLGACGVWMVAARPGLARGAGNEAPRRGVLVLRVVDADSGRPVMARMHLRDKRNRPVRPKGMLAWHDHFLVERTARLELRPGAYHFEIERGPEYRVRHGHFTIEPGAEETHTVELERFVDLAREGWYSGDLHIHRKPEQMASLVRAEDVRVAPVVTWSNKGNLWKRRPFPDPLLAELAPGRWVHWMAGEDRRGGGALLYLNLPKPLRFEHASREFPGSAHFLKEAYDLSPDVHVAIAEPWAWDLPLWLATGKVGSIGLAHGHFLRDGVRVPGAGSRPWDRRRYRPPHGLGIWSLDLYERILEAGLRLPPSAGSASGVQANPVGYNRVYVHCGDDFSYARWFEGLRAGRVFVTNGPLLRVKASGKLPGHVFYGTPGEPLELRLTIRLSTRVPVRYIEIVKNGRIERRLGLRKKTGKSPLVVFRESGWFLVRVISDHEKTFRFASTGPFYVDFGGTPRISRKAAEFFLEWLTERARRLPRDDPDRFQELIGDYRKARDFWKARIDKATVP